MSNRNSSPHNIPPNSRGRKSFILSPELIERPLDLLRLFVPLNFEPEKGINDPAIHRKFDCENYDKCLNYAAYKDWKSFSCKKCEGL